MHPGHAHGDPIYIDIVDDSATVIDALIEEEIKAERKRQTEIQYEDRPCHNPERYGVL